MANRGRHGTARKSVTLAIGDIEDWMRGQLEEQLLDFAHGIIEDATLFGEDRMKEIIETAITRTGAERAATSGGHPGRIDSGNMIDDIQSNIDLFGGSRVEGSWGWELGLEIYYLYQEYGTADIEGMMALQQSYVEAREMMLERLSNAGLKVS
ncbi:MULTISPECIES: hypothetical protein [unclassified Microbacterium]|uniref:hypothetical protein n=1 Tax=unclassified Microbacterium TaxID=2609290 RepID=UPI000EA8D059|nr:MULTISPECIES: hypothetical protein [unclassified Microbacterium]MBT2484862.1 hypothetical protein [Microbacterium sp. ISL-108]RKN67732.1 hypothetical protein D7252_09095 [Microbacterium sp. CGR2]